MTTDAFAQRAYLDDQVRGLVLRRAHLDHGSQVLAILTWGLDPANGLPPRALRSSLRRVAPQLGPVVDRTPTWTELTRKARRIVAATHDDAARGETAVSVARSYLGRCLLVPVVARQAATAAARRAAAWIAVQTLRQLAPGGSGWRTVQVSADDLAVALGMSRPTAAAALRRAEELGWIHRVSGGPGVTSRYRPALTTASGTGERLDRGDCYDHVEALSRLDDDEVLVALLTSVDHPAWSVLGQRAWTVALADATGLPPVHLGVSRGTVRAARADLARLELGPVDSWTGTSLRAALDRVADTPGPDGRTPRMDRADAVLARRERAEAQAEAKAAFAAQRAAERAKKASARKAGKKAGQESVRVEPVETAPVDQAVWRPLPAGYDHDNADHRTRLASALRAAGQRPVAVDLAGRRVRVEPVALVA